MKKDIFKYIIGLGTVLILRLMPHPPNVEPIMSTMMPFAKKWGWISGLMFTLIAVLVFDLITGTIGLWSLFTVGCYAILGIVAGLYFKKKKNRIRNYVGFSIIGTLFYDAVTGFGVGMLIFKQSFMMTLMGQIPFTLYHLLGNVILAAVVSPLLYIWVMDNSSLDTHKVIHRIRSIIPG